MRIVIDQHAGFCFGVERSIKMAEAGVKSYGKLYCLGELVHNEEEISRLQQLGVEFIDSDTYANLKSERVLLRAHGESPETYRVAKSNQIELLDGSCPIVLKLQERLKIAQRHMGPEKGQIVLYGDKNHPEVKGLSGQLKRQLLVVSEHDDLEKIDFDKKVHLFSQTTKDAEGFKQIESAVEQKFILNTKDPKTFLKTSKSLCAQVSKRLSKMKTFAAKVDVLVFVAGKNSSNGKQLFNTSKAINPNTYFVSAVEEFEEDWIKNASLVGISGATSTPFWLMEKLAKRMEQST